MVFNLHLYHFTPGVIPFLLVAGLALGSSFFLLRYTIKSRYNQFLLYFCWLVALSQIVQALGISAMGHAMGMVWLYIHYITLIVFPVLLYTMASVATNLFPRNAKIVNIIAVISGLMTLLLWHPLSFKQIVKYYWGIALVGGIMPPVLLMFAVICFSFSGIYFRRYYRWLTDPIQKTRVRYMTVAYLFVFLGYIDLLPAFGVGIYPLGGIFLLAAVLTFILMIVECLNLESKQREANLKESIEERSNEVARVVEELKAAQLKMIETSKLSAVASLGAGILHQISQPITAIHGFVRFMKKEMKETDPFYKPVQLMEEQSTYIKDMLEDLMALIRHREIKKENVDVNDSVKRVTNLLTDELRIRRINWDTQLAEDLPPVYADAVHLQQIFMNIIVNAIQALTSLPKGSVRRLIISTSYDKKTNKVIVSFEDNGPGLSEDDKTQIFEPFFTTKTKGSGIGLALSKDLVAEHGGELSAVNKPDAGAVFIVKLPVADKNGERRVQKLE